MTQKSGAVIDMMNLSSASPRPLAITRNANRTLLAEQAMHLLLPREKNKSGA